MLARKAFAVVCQKILKGPHERLESPAWEKCLEDVATLRKFLWFFRTTRHYGTCEIRNIGSRGEDKVNRAIAEAFLFDLCDLAFWPYTACYRPGEMWRNRLRTNERRKGAHGREAAAR